MILKVTLGAAAAMAEGLPVPDEWYNSALFTDYVALFGNPNLSGRRLIFCHENQQMVSN